MANTADFKVGDRVRVNEDVDFSPDENAVIRGREGTVVLAAGDAVCVAFNWVEVHLDGLDPEHIRLIGGNPAFFEANEITLL